MDDAARRQELADFLRHRRASVSPQEVGFPTGVGRRAAGLRREEVAAVSGVGLSWYTWLEQARRVNPSSEVIEALALALRLTDDEHDHLRALAGLTARRRAGASDIPPFAQPLVDSLLPAPAYVSTDRWDVLAWNRAETLLLPELEHVDAEGRNVALLLFTAPSARQTLPLWRDEARRVVAQLRAQTASRPGDAVDALLVERLQAAGPDFDELWHERDVARFSSHERLVLHPSLGALRFWHQRLDFTDDPRIRLTVYLPATRETRERLSDALLA